MNRPPAVVSITPLLGGGGGGGGFIEDLRYVNTLYSLISCIYTGIHLIYTYIHHFTT